MHCLRRSGSEKVAEERIFIGIDLNNERVMVSFFSGKMRLPETVSTVSGEERFRIPTAVFCSEKGNYFYGEEALKRQNRTDGSFFENLYSDSLNPEHVAARGMLVQLFRRLIRFKENYGSDDKNIYLAVTIPEITEEAVRLFDYVRSELEISPDSFQLMDYGESFFAYAYHQEASICRHDVAVFTFQRERISFVLLHADGYGMMKRVTSERKEWVIPENQEAEDAQKDEFFANIVREAFLKKVISGVYFIGDGFDGGWMNETLRVVGPNRRVFRGKNLFTLGACYAGYRNLVTEGWNYYYDAAYKLQGEVSLKVQKRGEPCFLRLSQLGENWFLPTESHYFLYDGDPKLEVWIRFRQRMNPRIETFTLDYLPDRAPGSIRLGVRAVPVSGEEIRIRVWDDGFGELFESTGKIWEYTIKLIEGGGHASSDRGN